MAAQTKIASARISTTGFFLFDLRMHVLVFKKVGSHSANAMLVLYTDVRKMLSSEIHYTQFLPSLQIHR